MKTQHVILLLTGFAAGAATVYVVQKQKVEYLQKGDKGKEVQAIEQLLGIAPTGLFSNELQQQVEAAFAGTRAYASGKIEKGFAKDVMMIFKNNAE